MIPGTRVSVYGRGGTVVWADGDTVAVRLDGEGARVDLWHVSQVRP